MNLVPELVWTLVMQAASGSSTFRAAVELAATVAIAVFAGVQVWREIRRDREGRKAADSRAESIAFLLRRQLRSWLGIEPARPDFEDWLVAARNAKSLGAELDRAESRMTALMELLGQCSTRVATGIRQAYVTFFSGTGHLNRYVATDQPSDSGGRFDWRQWLKHAERDLRACVEALESAPVGRALLEAEGTLARMTEADDPFVQAADEVERIRRNRLGLEAADSESQ